MTSMATLWQTGRNRLHRAATIDVRWRCVQSIRTIGTVWDRPQSVINCDKHQHTMCENLNYLPQLVVINRYHYMKHLLNYHTTGSTTTTVAAALAADLRGSEATDEALFAAIAE